MTILRVGLVVEGPTDFVVLKEFLREFTVAKRRDLEIVFIDLQPSPDSTTGSPEGGWTAVYQWCLRNPPIVRNELLYGQGLFANGLDAKICDIILVVMDADICVLLETTAPLITVPLTLETPEERGSYVHSVMISWLWPDATPPDRRLVAAPAVEMVETWLIAALADDRDVERLTDPLRRLAEIDYVRRSRPLPKNIKKIEKKQKRYQPLAAAAASNFQAVLENCIWFSHLIEGLKSHLVESET